MQRHGQIIRLKPGKLEEYRRLHAAVWPEVLATLKKCKISNYAIYHKDGLLFACFEYLGNDFEADMRVMAADPKTQEWWSLTDPCQEPWSNRRDGEWWAAMELLFHLD